MKFLDALTVRLDNRIELGLIQDTELAVPTTDTKPNLLLFVFPKFLVERHTKRLSALGQS